MSRRLDRWRGRLAVLLLLSFALTGGGCFLDHEIEPYYGRVMTPRAQEFRWSDGGLPQTFDPALAAAPPDTDVVRAMFEGLTEYEPQSLKPVPGVASRWEASADGREWTFYLRKDARWSNGDPVTAGDFVRSWQRTLQLGERAPHARLMENIVGAQLAQLGPAPAPAETYTTPNSVAEKRATPEASKEERAEEKREEKKVEKQKEEKPEQKKEEKRDEKKEEKPGPKGSKVEAPKPAPFGAEVVDDHTLRVRLQEPDQNFPALVAHPVFRPVHDSVSQSNEVTSNDAANSAQGSANSLKGDSIVSNGAFQLSKAGRDAVVLERAGNYWDAATVRLQRVQFIAARDAETALAAYRAGEVDAVTNAGFEPLGVKLLSAYKDFHRTTYGALTYYSVNTTRPPFDDTRVREALAIAIDRNRISEDELGGATEPAATFLPVEMYGMRESAESRPLEHDMARARSLLAEAGFPEGKGFPRVRLLINRNEQQRLVAQSVAGMWRNVLGIETDVIVKNWDEYEAAVRAGDYDVVRRGMVMQTPDELTNMRLMFEAETRPPVAETAGPQSETTINRSAAGEATEKKSEGEEKHAAEKLTLPPPLILSETQALKELPAIPIYFASSYTLVKPYVGGFDTNVLDAPSLKRVQLDTNWQQQPKTTTINWIK